jgi:hypothetical protein
MVGPRRRHVARLLIVALAALCVWAPAASASRTVAGVPFDNAHFIDAIKDAAVPEPSEIDNHLFALSGDNARLHWRDGTGGREVLAVAVMTADTYGKYYASGAGTTPSSKPVLWVTLAPQLRDWCRHLRRALREDAARLRKRVVQRLGLSPTTPYDRVVELWVDPAKVFRPCPDPAPGDDHCELQMKGAPQVEGIADYPSFFASLYVGAYGIEGAPWTRLGYTYDWGGGKEFGESEYMLTTSTHYEVASAGSVSDYCPTASGRSS